MSFMVLTYNCTRSPRETCARFSRDKTSKQNNYSQEFSEIQIIITVDSSVQKKLNESCLSIYNILCDLLLTAVQV